MTTITGVVLVGGGIPPVQARVEVRVVVPVFLEDGDLLLPAPQSFEISDADGTWSGNVDPLPEGFPYLFRIIMRSGEDLDSRTVTVPASGTVPYGDLVDAATPANPGYSAPPWVATVLEEAEGFADAAAASAAEVTAAIGTAATDAAALAADGVRSDLQTLVDEGEANATAAATSAYAAAGSLAAVEASADAAADSAAYAHAQYLLVYPPTRTQTILGANGYGTLTFLDRFAFLSIKASNAPAAAVIRFRLYRSAADRDADASRLDTVGESAGLCPAEFKWRELDVGQTFWASGFDVFLGDGNTTAYYNVSGGPVDIEIKSKG